MLIPSAHEQYLSDIQSSLVNDAKKLNWNLYSFHAMLLLRWFFYFCFYMFFPIKCYLSTTINHLNCFEKLATRTFMFFFPSLKTAFRLFSLSSCSWNSDGYMTASGFPGVLMSFKSLFLNLLKTYQSLLFSSSHTEESWFIYGFREVDMYLRMPLYGIEKKKTHHY